MENQIVRSPAIPYKAKDYIHNSDKAAMEALKGIPGFQNVFKQFMKFWNERIYNVLNMSSRVRINEYQLPEYYEMLPPICEKLGIAVPDLYLELDVNPNSYTYGDTKPFIVVTSGLFETLPKELIPTVLAHECGHIACHHTLYTTIADFLLDKSAYALYRHLPYASFVTIPLEMAFFYWMRCSELSADRAAVLCDGTSEKTFELCMRFAGFDKDIEGGFNKREFIIQAKEYREMINSSKWDSVLETVVLMHMSHPLAAVRALEAIEWEKSERFDAILSGIHPEPEPIDKEDPKAKIKFELPKFFKKDDPGA